MKWNFTAVDGDGKRVRKAYFQDHRVSHELMDHDGSYMTLTESPGGRVIAEARRAHGRYWSVKLTDRPRAFSFTLINGKDEAITAMLSGRTTEGTEGVIELSGRVSIESPALGQGPLRMWHQNARGEHYDFIMAKDAEERLLEVLLARRSARLAAMMEGN